MPAIYIIHIHIYVCIAIILIKFLDLKSKKICFSPLSVLFIHCKLDSQENGVLVAKHFGMLPRQAIDAIFRILHAKCCSFLWKGVSPPPEF